MPRLPELKLLSYKLQYGIVLWFLNTPIYSLVSAVFIYTCSPCISCHFQFTKAPFWFCSLELPSPFCRVALPLQLLPEDEFVVHLKTGPVRERPQKSIFGLNLEYFLGIPYAAAPAGDLRFSPPQPVQPWEDVRAGTSYGARCPQNEDSFLRNITVGMFKVHSIDTGDNW